MSGFTPKLKHRILQQYQPYSKEHSFSALARHYAVAGGESTIRKWHQQWNGTAASLERKAVSGRPRALNKTQVKNYIRMPIENKRRVHAAVHYTDLLLSVRQKTGKPISLRTVQRRGKEDLGVKQKRSKKRTASESK
jgi:transposase